MPRPNIQDSQLDQPPMNADENQEMHNAMLAWESICPVPTYRIRNYDQLPIDVDMLKNSARCA